MNLYKVHKDIEANHSYRFPSAHRVESLFIFLFKDISMKCLYYTYTDCKILYDCIKRSLAIDDFKYFFLSDGYM